ncbi:winged helix-turn-helix domain-containing protein [Methanolobus bombayensis]|uniref:winged helix-turn-helix domain-containing protein n=1 Tax=Methanolobus bombayensis TaxID=38023 RepID=UPI001AE4F45F|nr:winged helix-turn-helix domain-containing protein [Methanolobus bombayensis]MBP1908420.1 DNA-binding transcriptional ArsR family regulator [Methanolobus bombayensis]
MSSNIISSGEIAKDNIYLEEFRSLRSEIKSLKKDVNRALEISGHRHADALFMEMKGGLSRPLVQYMMADTKESLNMGFDNECDKGAFCKLSFSGLLQEMALLLLENKVNEDSLAEFRNRFNELKEKAAFENCDSCIETASQIFDKQMDLIRSFNVSASEEQSSMGTIDIKEVSDDIVSQICEPLANKQRLAILRLLNFSTRSFSDISKSTGLRGGNLLFHIQKLLDTGLILQRSERGDYMITRKGHMTLKGMAELIEKLNSI